MDHIENLPTPKESDPPAVTGRKAARSLMLFRGDGHNIEALIESDPASMPLNPSNHSHDSSKMPPTQHSTPCLLQKKDPSTTAPQRPILEHASSATYFPHLPQPVRDYITNDDPLTGTSPETANLQHLMADLEFDRDTDGDITQIKNHTTARDDKRRVGFADSANDPDPACDARFNLSKIHSSSIDADVFPLTVELRPFKNKVGGHTAIFRFSKRAVCKALMNRENLWYEAVERKHPELLKFIPRYIGVLNVRYSSLVTETTPPSPTLPTRPQLPEAGPPPSTARVEECPPRPNSPGKPSRRNRLTEDGPAPEVSLDDNRHIIPSLLRKQYSHSAPSSSTIDHMSLSPDVSSGQSYDFAPDKNDVDASIGSTSVNTDLQAQIIQEVFVPPGRKSDDIFQMDDVASNELGLEDDQQQQQQQQLPNDYDNAATTQNAGTFLRKHTRFERFILLEDLTANMKRPCALDLKMGTRQYGLDANDAKQASQRKKCALTTSRELGVRVCGLQVWDQEQGKYYMKDKYFGRKLRSGTPFARTLAKFLYDGRTAYSIVVKIPNAIKQLSELFDIYKHLVGYRMYGLSVLLMYDGAGDSTETQLMVHIIDFAQSVIGDESDVHQYRKPPAHPHLPDKGYLRGLQSIKRYIEKIFEVVTGTRYCEVSDSVQEYLKNNKERLLKPFEWVETAEDIFESEAEQDEEGISD